MHRFSQIDHNKGGIKMRFHCTKKLLDMLNKSSKLLDFDPLPVQPVDKVTNQDELNDWHASLTEVDGSYIATFINDLTSFPVVVGLFDLDNIYEAFEGFENVLGEVMLKQKIDKQIVFEYLEDLEPPILTKTISRAKTGPLSAVTIDAQNILYEEGTTSFDPVEVTIELSETPRVKNGKAFFPAENWLEIWDERSKLEESYLVSTGSDETLAEKNLPSQKDWIAFYEVVDKIKKETPWRKIYDDELIAVKDPESEEWTYCSVMGRLGEFSGIGLFEGDKGLKSLVKVYSVDHFIPEYQLKSIQDCLLLSYVSRSEIETDNYDRLQKLGLVENQYYLLPEIMKHTPGFVPWSILSQAEVKRATLILNQVLTVLNNLTYADELPRLMDGLVTSRYKQDGKWETSERPLPDLQSLFEQDPYIFENDLVLHQIKKAPKSPLSLQVDAVHAPAILQEYPEERPYYPMITLCVEEESMEVLNAVTYPETKENPKHILECVVEVCKDMRPKEIIIRTQTIEWVLEDFCNKTDIKLVVRERLPEFDEVVSHLENEFS